MVKLAWYRWNDLDNQQAGRVFLGYTKAKDMDEAIQKGREIYGSDCFYRWLRG